MQVISFRFTVAISAIMIASITHIIQRVYTLFILEFKTPRVIGEEAPESMF